MSVKKPCILEYVKRQTMCLWDWHFYHPCLHIDRIITFWILKNLSLTLRDTLERISKVSCNQNLFSRPQSRYWNATQKMNSNDKVFSGEMLSKRIEQSDWPYNFWSCRVFHYSFVRVALPPSVKKWPNLHLSWAPPHQIFRYSPGKSYSILLLLEVGD